LGVHIYYLDGIEMSNEKEILRNFSGFFAISVAVMFLMLSGHTIKA
jgi:hypothetical protein